jgi:HSP20 family protein
MFKNLISRPKQQEGEQNSSDPGSDLTTMQTSFDKLLQNFWNTDSDDLWNERWGCDVQDSENEIIVRAEAPGFEPDEINVQLCGNRLVVEAEHKSEGDGENGHYSKYGKLYRSITVPCGVEADRVEANYKNGILQINLPKDQASCAKRISVSAK